MKHPRPDLSLAVSRETGERLATFVDVLLTWNRRINLVAHADEHAIWKRHVDDSLQLIPWLGSAAAYADIGTGGGFPGLIVAIASGLPAHLIEADQRKAAFLREAARLTSTAVTVHACRAEAVTRVRVPLITARAVAPVNELLGLAAPLLEWGGSCLFLKGRRVEDELTSARRHWHITVDRAASRTDPDGSVLRIHGIRRVECGA
jgi:16S rRNA (guanine527-N7)-methyltransferase